VAKSFPAAVSGSFSVTPSPPAAPPARATFSREKDTRRKRLVAKAFLKAFGACSVSFIATPSPPEPLTGIVHIIKPALTRKPARYLAGFLAE